MNNEMTANSDCYYYSFEDSCILSTAIKKKMFFPPGPDASLVNKNHQDVRNYVRQFNVIDNQRILSQMSHRLEPRRT